MKDIKGVLTDFDAISYFLECENEVEDCKSIWESETYKKSMRRHLVSTIPSIIFAILLGIMFLVLINYSPNIREDLSFLFIIVAIVLTLLYLILLDLDKFRIKHDKFIQGHVVGTSKDEEKMKVKYYLIFVINNGKIIASRVSKKDYLDAKPNEKFWIFLEGEGLFAVKS